MGLQAAQQHSQQASQPGAQDVTSQLVSAAEIPKGSSKPAMHGKRAAAGSPGEIKPHTGVKKAKSTPVSQLQKAAAAKGQRTMAAFFPKKN